MRRLMIGVVLAAMFLAGPSYAQQKPDNALSDDEKVAKSVADEVDRQYRATLDKTRKEVVAPQSDPWSNMRGTDNSKTKR